MVSCSYCSALLNGPKTYFTLTTGGHICDPCISKHTQLQCNEYNALKRRQALVQKELDRTNHPLSRLGAGFDNFLFGTNTSKKRDLEKRIKLLDTLILKAKKDMVARNTIAAQTTTYPPDWSLRREIVIAESGGRCRKCRAGAHLHVHHIQRLADGGSNKIHNLEALCYSCHAQTHNVKSFPSHGTRKSENALTKRIKTLNEAINERRNVSFGYQKGGENKPTRRRISPKQLKSYKRANGSTSVCVVGYCFMRRAEREFAINKMTRLKKLKT